MLPGEEIHVLPQNLKLMVEIKKPRDMAEGESSFHVVVGQACP
jgi:hypothetical protein